MQAAPELRKRTWNLPGRRFHMPPPYCQVTSVLAYMWAAISSMLAAPVSPWGKAALHLPRGTSFQQAEFLFMIVGMEAQARYWDAVAYKKSFGHPLLMGELEKRAGLAGCILDYGCGYGRSIRQLHDAGFAQLFGVDTSSGMIARAMAENPFARYVRNSGLEIPFANKSFDAALLLAVLTCMPDSGAQARLFSELLRVLKVGGILYVSDLLINGDERNRRRYQRFEPRHGLYGVFELDEGVTLRHHTREHLDQLAAPFETITAQEFLAETMNGHQSRAIRMILQKPPANLPA